MKKPYSPLLMVAILLGFAPFCRASAPNSVMPNPVIANFVVDDVSCFGGADGSILLDVSGGTPPYMFLWSNNGTSNPLTGLAAGTYSVTVEDAIGGTAVQTGIVVGQPTEISVTTSIAQPPCYYDNGTVTLEASGGTTIFGQYYVSKHGDDPLVLRQMPFVFSSLPGTYTAIIEDDNGCQTTHTYTVTAPPTIVFSASTEPVSCYGGSDGTIEFTASGGTGALEYSIDNGQNYQSNPLFENLPGGTYNLRVRDANGCMTPELPLNLEQPFLPLNATATGGMPLCNGGTDGQIVVEVSDGAGTPGYEFSLDGGPFTGPDPGFLLRKTYPSLTGGSTHELTVRDANGCTLMLTETVPQPDPIVVDAALTTAPPCFGDDGIITVVTSGGTPLQPSGQYNVLVNYVPVGQQPPTYSFAANGYVGNYFIQVQDANGCTDDASVLVTHPPFLFAQGYLVEPVDCPGGFGTVHIDAFGGTPPYSGDGDQPAPEGSSTLTVTDTHGCSFGVSFNLAPGVDAVPPTISCPADASFGTNAGCAVVEVNFGEATATDDCAASPTISNDAPLSFPIGTTTVIWTADDGNGNQATCTQIITVTDDDAPVLTCPANVVAVADAGVCGATIYWEMLPPSDNCSSVSISAAPNNGSFFPLGASTVTITATDESGNSSTCNFEVTVNPASEICNELDDDCDGQIDEGLGSTWYADADGDGFGDAGQTLISCSQPSGYAANDDDCDDSEEAINPNAEEVCNDIDDNCDGLVDNGASMIWYQDWDMDGYGNDALPTYSGCTPPNAMYAPQGGDCQDEIASINPGAAEVCNWLDDDCNGTADDGLTFIAYYDDNDGDGFGEYFIGNHCAPPANSATVPGDCNNWNPNVYPGATETCNWQDDDCDGQIDEGVMSVFYADLDGDGYGNPAISTLSCSAPPNHVANADDCNDNQPSVHPGASEVCDDLDNDCDGSVDEGLVFINYYSDNDHDGFGQYLMGNFCTPPANAATQSGDCNDWNASIHPGATEVCNWQDDDCDGSIDEGIGSSWYQDADQDGYGNSAVKVIACFAPYGYVSNKLDCNDTDPSIKPGAPEVCDGIDNNCDGQVDNVPSGRDLIVLYADAPATATPGGSITVSGEIQNLRASTAGNNKVRWWLSNDEVPGNSNDYSPNNGNNAWNVSTNNITACATKYFSKTITIPSSGWVGSKYLIFKADGLNNINEADEGNNLWVQPIEIVAAGNGQNGNYLVGGTPTITLYAQHHAHLLRAADLHWVAKAPDGSQLQLQVSSDGIDFQEFEERPHHSSLDGSMQLLSLENLQAGRHFYRVAIKLPDGSLVYSNIVDLEIGGNDAILVAPNPSEGRVKISMPALAGKEVVLLIGDAYGRVLLKRDFDSFTDGTFVLDLAGHGLKDGIYSLSLVHLGRAYTQRLVIAGTGSRGVGSGR